MRSLMIIALALMLTPLAAGAATWHVDLANTTGPWDGSAEHPFQTIQEGIDAAAATGDTVLVEPGTYLERVLFEGKSVTVQSMAGAAATTIEFGEGERAVEFDLGEDAGAVLDGFTVTNGGGAGGGITCYQSTPIIRNCVITGCSANTGAGFLMQEAAALVEDCTISGNTAAYQGGGLYLIGQSDATISNCTISGNLSTSHSGGGAHCWQSTVTFRDCSVTGNIAPHGGGLLFYDTTDCLVERCTISGNFAASQGGGVSLPYHGQANLVNTIIDNNTVTGTGSHGAGLYLWDASSAQVINCTLADNSAGAEGGAVFSAVNSGATLRNCIVWGNGSASLATDGGNIDIYFSDYEEAQPASSNIALDPLFAGGGDYHITAESPCIDAGTELTAPADDIDGQARPRDGDGDGIAGYDMGADEVLLVPDTVSASLTCTPDSGTVPFATQMSVGLANLVYDQARRLSARLDVSLAGGQQFPNWRSGYTNVAAGSAYATAWNQGIPALGTVIGENTFALTAADVTPAPWNQPPYAPSGDTAGDGCTVIGNAP